MSKLFDQRDMRDAYDLGLGADNYKKTDLATAFYGGIDVKTLEADGVILSFDEWFDRSVYEGHLKPPPVEFDFDRWVVTRGLPQDSKRHYEFGLHQTRRGKK